MPKHKKENMKDFEKLSEEEQNEVILNIASKLTGQEIWYWEGLVHKLHELERIVENIKMIENESKNVR